MKQLQLNGYTLGVVDVPGGATNLIIVKDQLRYKIDPLKYWWDLIKLPPGQWSILGRLNDITEEQAAGLVERFTQPIGWNAKGKSEATMTLYMNYEIERPVPVSLLCTNGKESLESFFRSHGIEGNPLIIIKEKV